MNIKKWEWPFATPSRSPITNNHEEFERKVGGRCGYEPQTSSLVRRCVSMLTPFHPFCRFIAIQADLKCCISAIERNAPWWLRPYWWWRPCSWLVRPCWWLCPCYWGKRPRGRKKAVYNRPKAQHLNLILWTHILLLCNARGCLVTECLIYALGKWLSATAARGYLCAPVKYIVFFLRSRLLF